MSDLTPDHPQVREAFERARSLQRDIAAVIKDQPMTIVLIALGEMTLRAHLASSDTREDAILGRDALLGDFTTAIDRRFPSN